MDYDNYDNYDHDNNHDGLREDCGMAWLTGFTYRKKITIDHTKVDADLTHFPVTVFLGPGQKDVFLELAYADRKKIAFTRDDETTELYGEIEQYDVANKRAVYHVSGAGWVLSSSVDTIFYLYFDSTHADNTAHIGDSGGAVAQNVWDSNFKAVYHMSQDPTGGSGCILDSTSNGNHGTPAGSMTSDDLVDGLVGKALDFDGIDDFVDCGDVASIDGATKLTIEAVINKDADVLDGAFARKWYSGEKSFSLGFHNEVGSEDDFKFMISDGSNLLVGRTTNGSIVIGSTYYIVGVWSGGNTVLLYQDAISKAVDYAAQNTPSSVANTAEHLGIGARYNNGSPNLFFDGKIGEIRISTTDRAEAWVKATNYSLKDQLVQAIEMGGTAGLIFAMNF